MTTALLVFSFIGSPVVDVAQDNLVEIDVVGGPSLPAEDLGNLGYLEDPTQGLADLLASISRVINDWRSVGWLAGLIAFINFLIALLRFKPIDEALSKLDWKWIKPSLAAGLGALLGGFSTMATGASVGNSAVAGMLAGLGSVGFHQLIDSLRKSWDKKVKSAR